MTLGSGWSVGRPNSEKELSLSKIPLECALQTEEQRRSFELLRLALFALKLRKLELGPHPASEQDYAFRCNLLRHAIFQQVVILGKLHAREQALRLISACRSAN